MAGYIGKSQGVTQVDGYNRSEADAEFVDVTGDTMTGALTIDADGATVLTVDRATSNGTIIDLQKDGSSVGSIASYFGNLMIGKESGARIAFSSTGIYSSNNSGTTEDASYALGTSSSRFTDLYLSGGVYLGGTGSANYLDDYEEGTWTPTYISAAGLANVTGITVEEAIYTKVGKFVKLQAKINFSTTGLETIVEGDYLYLQGLPFAANLIGSGGLDGNIGTCHVYGSLGSVRNSFGFIQLEDTQQYYAYFYSVKGSIDTGDPVFLEMSYRTTA